LTALSLGVIASASWWGIVIFWNDLPMDFRESFRGGNFGAITLVAFVVLGFLGILLFLINSAQSVRELLWIRVGAIACFLVVLASGVGGRI
jgi:hypothetical protein